MDTERSPLASLVPPQHTPLLVIDMKRFFTDRPQCPPLDEMLPRLRRLIDAARAAAVPLVFTKVVIPKERWTDPWAQQFPAFVQEVHAQGSPFHPDFAPQPGDVTLIKDRYSAFIGTGLEAWLRERGIRTVIVAGLVTDICVAGTARDAFQLDFHTITLSDCAAAGSQAKHDVSLESLAACFGRVCTSEEVLAAWQAAPALAAAEAS